MRTTLAVLFAIGLPSGALGVPIVGSGSIGGRAILTFDIGGDEFRLSPRFSESVMLTGSLNTETEEITYDPQSWNLSGAQRTKQVLLLSEDVVPPTCDINGCTPEMVIPAKRWTATISVDPMTVNTQGFTVPVTDYDVRSASTGLPPGGLVSVSEITGTWRINGPTESKSGTFSVPSGAWLLGPDRIGLTRDPAETGPVVEWGVGGGTIRVAERRATVASNVLVDGRQFDIRALPEPSTIAMMALAGGAMLAPARRRT